MKKKILPECECTGYETKAQDLYFYVKVVILSPGTLTHSTQHSKRGSVLRERLFLKWNVRQFISHLGHMTKMQHSDMLSCAVFDTHMFFCGFFLHFLTINRPVRSSDCACAENGVDSKTKHTAIDYLYAQCKTLVLFKINRNAE